MRIIPSRLSSPSEGGEINSVLKENDKYHLSNYIIRSLGLCEGSCYKCQFKNPMNKFGSFRDCEDRIKRYVNGRV
jgi:hypothetical protein